MTQVNWAPDIVIGSTWADLSIHYKITVYMQID